MFRRKGFAKHCSDTNSEGWDRLIRADVTTPVTNHFPIFFMLLETGFFLEEKERLIEIKYFFYDHCQRLSKSNTGPTYN